MRPLVARIDTGALDSNFRVARKVAPGSRIFAVIKADAYGHGAVQCANMLDQADGFAIATVEEGIVLRQAGVDKPILVLSGFSQLDETGLLHRHRLMPVIHSRYQLELVQGYHRGERPIHCWLKIDTGMNRLGLEPAKFRDVLSKLPGMRQLRLAGVLSHLACADNCMDSFTRDQVTRFDAATAGLDVPLSLANSGGVLGWPDTHRHWNRPGLMLYGASPLLHHSAGELGLKPVMTLASELISVKKLPDGAGIGYGLDFTADRDMMVGIVACGYADGYPRHAGTGTPVLIDGHRSRTLGRVSMDTLAVDLDGVSGAAPGMEVVLWGKDLPVEEVARAAGSVSYELLTRVTARVPRLYA